MRETWAAREGRAVGRVGCVVVAVAWRSCRAVSAVGGRASHSEFSGLTNPAGLNTKLLIVHTVPGSISHLKRLRAQGFVVSNFENS